MRSRGAEMIGTVANALAVVIGSAIGLLLRARAPSAVLNLAKDALGLFTIGLGAGMALEMANPVAVVVSLLLGTAVGYAVDLEERMGRLTARLSKSSSSFSEGVMTAFLTFCVGPMTVIGSLRDGMGDPTILFTKAVMDGAVSIAYSASLGWGVMASAVPLLAFQGSLALLGWVAKATLPQASVSSLTAVGGILLMGVGVNLLNLRRVRVGDMLPSLIFALLLPLLAR